MKIPRSIRYSTGTPCEVQVGTSAHDMLFESLVGYGILSLSMTQSGRSLPARQCDSASIGLFTVESTCLPTSCTATSPPPLYGMYVIFLPVVFSSITVMIWSSCFEPVPPILKLLSG